MIIIEIKPNAINLRLLSLTIAEVQYYRLFLFENGKDVPIINSKLFFGT